MVKQRDGQSNRYLGYVFANKKVIISVIGDKNSLDSQPRFNEIGNKFNTSDLVLLTQT